VVDGAVGELHVRGPNVMRGYYRAAAATAAAIDNDGWFNTGDLARFEGEALFIAGRTKELIIRSGFNVYRPRSKRSSMPILRSSSRLWSAAPCRPTRKSWPMCSCCPARGLRPTTSWLTPRVS